MIGREQVAEKIKKGDVTGALGILDRLLADQPENADLLSLMGLAHAIGGKLGEAEAALLSAMQHAASPSQKLKHGSNLAMFLLKEKRISRLGDLAKLNWSLAEATRDRDFDAEALKNLCTAMSGGDQHQFVVDQLSAVVDSEKADWFFERTFLVALCKVGRAQAALDRIQGGNFRWRDEIEFLAVYSFVKEALGLAQDASNLRDAYIAAAPAYIAERKKGQKRSIVLLSPNPSSEGMTHPAVEQHLYANFPSQMANRYSSRYRFCSVFVGSQRDSLRSTTEIEPTLLINNCVNSETLWSPGFFAQVRTAEDFFGLPIVNPAKHAVACTRQENAIRFQDLAGAHVPRVQRYELDLALIGRLQSTISRHFFYPIIIRSVGDQNAANIHCVASAKELGNVLGNLGRSQFYVIDYMGKKHANGFYRRIRAAFVGGIPTIMRADYSSGWVVKGRKTDDIRAMYGKNGKLRADADDIVSRPHERLGSSAMDVINRIGKAMPLDVFGLDFDVDDEGKLVFFEANSTMNLLSNAPPEIDYPKHAEAEFMENIDRFFSKVAAGPINRT